MVILLAILALALVGCLAYRMGHAQGEHDALEKMQKVRVKKH
jgi:hypothetical protein